MSGKNVWTRFGEEVFGPFTPEQIRSLVSHCDIDHETRISLDGKKWSPAGKFRDLHFKSSECDSGDAPEDGSGYDLVETAKTPTSSSGEIADGDIVALDVWSGTLNLEWQIKLLVDRVAVSPNSRVAAAGCKDGSLRFYRIGSGEKVFQCRGHTDAIASLDFSPDGQFIASCAYEKLIRIWNPSQRQLVRTIETELRIYRVQFTPDSEFLWVGGDKQMLGLFRVSSGELVGSWSPGKVVFFHPKASCCAYSCDGMFGGPEWGFTELPSPLATGDSRRLNCRRFHWLGARFSSAALNPHLPRLAIVGSENGNSEVSMYDLSEMREMKNVSLEKEQCAWNVVFGPEGEVLLTGGRAASGRAELILWQAYDLEKLASVRTNVPYSGFEWLAITPSGSKIVAGGTQTLSCFGIEGGRI